MDITETSELGEGCEVMDIFTVMNKCERLSNILLLSKIYNISSKDTNHCKDQEL